MVSTKPVETPSTEIPFEDSFSEEDIALLRELSAKGFLFLKYHPEESPEEVLFAVLSEFHERRENNE